MSVERAPRLIRFLRLRQRLELRQPRGVGEPSSAEQSLRYPAEPLPFGELRPGGTVEASGWFPQAHSPRRFCAASCLKHWLCVAIARPASSSRSRCNEGAKQGARERAREQLKRMAALHSWHSIFFPESARPRCPFVKSTSPSCAPCRRLAVDSPSRGPKGASMAPLAPPPYYNPYPNLRIQSW